MNFFRFGMLLCVGLSAILFMLEAAQGDWWNGWAMATAGWFTAYTQRGVV